MLKIGLCIWQQLLNKNLLLHIFKNFAKLFSSKSSLGADRVSPASAASSDERTSLKFDSAQRDGQSLGKVRPVPPAVHINHFKEEIINQWETSLEIQSFEDVLTTPCACRHILSNHFFFSSWSVQQ
jgi:hypothetical protein